MSAPACTETTHLWRMFGQSVAGLLVLVFGLGSVWLSWERSQRRLRQRRSPG